MPSKPRKEAKTSFEIAKLLDEAADAIRRRSNRAYAAGSMTLDDYMDARARELELRSELSLIVATRLGDALAQAADAGQDIKQAIRDAKARIGRVRSARKGLEIVAALVTLAAALASGDAKRIATAGKAVAALG
jgi:hypothetical protein